MINREKYSYYPEAYAWLAFTLVVFLAVGEELVLMAGCVPGAAMALYYLYMHVQEKTEELRR